MPLVGVDFSADFKLWLGSGKGCNPSPRKVAFVRLKRFAVNKQVSHSIPQLKWLRLEYLDYGSAKNT